MDGAERQLDPALTGSVLADGVRGLPQMQRLLETEEAAVLIARTSRPEVVAALREELACVRAALLRHGGAVPGATALLAGAGARLARACPTLRKVLNATGIVLHTNLGRAPLADAALEAAIQAAQAYTNLEYALEAGERGLRAPGVEALLRDLTGAEAGLAVNNGAAAVLLALSALASGGEVLVSRGELVEIGGGFRIPDVIQQGGARLVEVGTTNKTRLTDYRDAITPATRVLLKVHPSNYRMVGFTAEASLPELAALARERGLLLVQDLGTGNLQDLARLGRPPEPTPAQSIAAGADLVAFSGDKLMGGPQAGLLAGQAECVAAMRGHPLMRALRLDKLALAALEATLRLHLDPAVAVSRVPVLRMLAQDEAVLQQRAQHLARLLSAPVQVEIVGSVAFAGGGTLPGTEMGSRAVALTVAGLAPEALARRLRRHRPAVVGRVTQGRVLLDVFALGDADLPDVAAAVQAAASA